MNDISILISLLPMKYDTLLTNNNAIYLVLMSCNPMVNGLNLCVYVYAISLTISLSLLSLSLHAIVDREMHCLHAEYRRGDRGFWCSSNWNYIW